MFGDFAFDQIVLVVSRAGNEDIVDKTDEFGIGKGALNDVWSYIQDCALV
jgi:hypothetical protein